MLFSMAMGFPAELGYFYTVATGCFSIPRLSKFPLPPKESDFYHPEHD